MLSLSQYKIKSSVLRDRNTRHYHFLAFCALGSVSRLNNTLNAGVSIAVFVNLDKMSTSFCKQINFSLLIFHFIKRNFHHSTDSVQQHCLYWTDLQTSFCMVLLVNVLLRLCVHCIKTAVVTKN